jgi:flagellar FliL protein
MADDKDKTQLEASEAAEGEDTGEKGGKSKLILFGGIGLGAIVIGVVLAMFVIKPMMSGSDESADQSHATESTQADDSGDGKAEETDDHGEEAGERGGKSKSLIYAISDIVVNPAGTGGSRFLSCSMAFETGNSKLHAAFQSKDAIVRDALITILSSKTVTQLTEPKQKEITRYQIKKRLEKLMHTDDLAGVYFTDFVLQ